MTISTIGTSGGNPGGQTLYQVSGLSQGDSFNVDWFYSGGDVVLSATGMITVKSLSDGRMFLDIMITNTTPSQGDLTAPITVFGIAAEGFKELNHKTGDGKNLYYANSGNFPGFDIDACGSTSANNCAGGDPKLGIGIGETDSFHLSFDGEFGETGSLSLFALKWQTSFGSFELAGVPSLKDVASVAEPASLVLLVAALGLLGLGARRRGTVRTG